MSFDLSQVLSSNLALAYQNSSGASSQSQVNLNAKELITSVVNEFASQLFSDDEFMGKHSMQFLSNFQLLTIDEEEFKSRTINPADKKEELEDQLHAIAYLCHSRNLKATNENRSLTKDEQTEISRAFAYLADAHADEKELSGKLAILSEAAPIITKVSEAYVKYIRPFDQQLNLFLKGVDLPQSVLDSVESYRDQFFPETSCTREGLKAIEEANVAPDYSLQRYDDCVNAFSNYILHIALVAHNENRELRASEIEAIRVAIKALRFKMGIMRMSKINHERLLSIREAYQNTQKELQQLPAEQKNTTREKSEEITVLEKELGDYNYYTKYVEKFKDLEKAINNGKKKRSKKLQAARGDLKQYTKSCVKRLGDLQHAKELQEKEIKKREAEWKQFVTDKYENTSLVQTDVEVKDSMYFRIGFLMENPEIVAKAASLFIGHLKSKVERLPQEEQKGWFSGISIF